MPERPGWPIPRIRRWLSEPVDEDEDRADRLTALAASFAANAQWPVGSIFLSVDPTDPAIKLGIGTWQALPGMRVLTSL
jgi:hypothetical protein